MTPEQIIERGRQADALLKNTLLNECFESILQRVSREWLSTPRESTIDRDKREELHARANAITALRGELNARLNDAVVEQNRIASAEKREKRAKPNG